MEKVTEIEGTYINSFDIPPLSLFLYIPPTHTYTRICRFESDSEVPIHACLPNKIQYGGRPLDWLHHINERTLLMLEVVVHPANCLTKRASAVSVSR